MPSILAKECFLFIGSQVTPKTFRGFSRVRDFYIPVYQIVLHLSSAIEEFLLLTVGFTSAKMGIVRRIGGTVGSDGKAVLDAITVAGQLSKSSIAPIPDVDAVTRVPLDKVAQVAQERLVVAETGDNAFSLGTHSSTHPRGPMSL